MKYECLEIEGIGFLYHNLLKISDVEIYVWKFSFISKCVILEEWEKLLTNCIDVFKTQPCWMPL